ncbi:MAG: zf-HC2 domain-containing protein [Woeseiaceae bacterium]|nr:zf-HC2 domain-containing protein [Woeseiaceae bacterium]
MNQAEEARDHRAIELLLPWYVNETLEEHEIQLVEAHLRHCSDCQNALRELQALSTAVRTTSATPLVPDAPVDAFLQSLDEAKPQRGSAWYGSRLAVAASLVAFVAAGILYTTLERPVASGDFQTVTQAEGVQIAYVFEVDYSGDVDESRRALSNAVPGATLMQSSGEDRVVVTMDSKTVSELEAFAASLQRIDGIDRVVLVGVQLPVD